MYTGLDYPSPSDLQDDDNWSNYDLRHVDDEEALELRNYDYDSENETLQSKRLIDRVVRNSGWL